MNFNQASIDGIQTAFHQNTQIQNQEIKAALSAILADATVSELTTEVVVTAAKITTLYTAPLEVVEGVSGKVIEFVSAVLIYDYQTATYVSGGSVTIQYTSGATISTTITSSNSFGATGDKVFSLAALNAAGGYTMPVNTGLCITNATGVFVNPGTAAGVGRLIVTYKLHTTGL